MRRSRLFWLSVRQSAQYGMQEVWRYTIHGGATIQTLGRWAKEQCLCVVHKALFIVMRTLPATYLCLRGLQNTQFANHMHLCDIDSSNTHHYHGNGIYVYTIIHYNITQHNLFQVL